MESKNLDDLKVGDIITSKEIWDYMGSSEDRFSNIIIDFPYDPFMTMYMSNKFVIHEIFKGFICERPTDDSWKDLYQGNASKIYIFKPFIDH